MEKKKNTLVIIGFFIFTIILIVAMVLVISKVNESEISENEEPTSPVIEPDVPEGVSSFDYTMIHTVNENYKENYMISPLSIGYALGMLKEGANEDTFTQIKTLLDDYKYPATTLIENKLSIANAIFINKIYEKDILSTYKDTLLSKYNVEVKYDEYKSPENINTWIKEKTFNMIPQALDSVESDTVISLVNAIAIDVEWKQKFDGSGTHKDTFTLKDGAHKDVTMMSDEDNFTYIRSTKAKGIIKDYAIYDTNGNIITEEEKDENSLELEYIAILPDDIDEYISTFDYKELYTLLSNKQVANDNLTLQMELPKYSYDFDYDTFKDSLMSLGMTDAFNPSKANFKNMSDKDLYISSTIHKSHIDVSEEGTKASATTIFTMKNTAIEVDNPKEIIKIEFNRPFLYLIKEKNSYNIWFFGVVYEPNEYSQNTQKDLEN